MAARWQADVRAFENVPTCRRPSVGKLTSDRSPAPCPAGCLRMAKPTLRAPETGIKLVPLQTSQSRASQVAAPPLPVLVSKSCHELMPTLSMKVGREFDALLSILFFDPFGIERLLLTLSPNSTVSGAPSHTNLLAKTGRCVVL